MNEIPAFPLSGTTRQTAQPDWEPLRLAVGDELLDWFMWMHEIECEDGTRLHAYKHEITRRYLHLTADATAYQFNAPSRYSPIALPAAMEDLFALWWDSPYADAPSVTAARAAIARAREAVAARAAGS